MNVAFRVDASADIGIGHLIRRLALDEEMKNKGHTCFFVTKIEDKGLINKIEKNHDHLQINPNATLDEDKQILLKFSDENRIEWIITDHYSINSDYTQKLKENNVSGYIAEIGGIIGKKWKEISEKHDLDVSIVGPNSLITFSFNYENDQELKTLFTQEMLERWHLASTTVYVSYSHKKEYLNDYFDAVDDVFGIIKKAIKNDNVVHLLKGPVAHTGFTRLT